MNAEQKRIHQRALVAREKFHNFELDFISILQDVERTRVHRALKKRSVHVYAVDVLGFNNAVAYMFIAVARKALVVPDMLQAGLSVFVLSRLVSTIHPENAAELIHIAQTKTSRELDVELGRRNPKYKPERTKIHSEECVELTLKVSPGFLKKLERVQSLRAQKDATAGVGFTLEAGLDEYLRRHDPVQKAERAQAKQGKPKQTEPKATETKGTETKRTRDERNRQNEQMNETPAAAALVNNIILGRDLTGKSNQEFCAHRKMGRIPLSSVQRHAVFTRDQGKCTHLEASGELCGSDRWVHIHHVVQVARGGTNEPENLRTLCSFHHDMIHQGQIGGRDVYLGQNVWTKL